MISQELIELTIIDLLDESKTPNAHIKALKEVKPELLADIIKEMNSFFEEEMISYALQEKDIHVPHIGYIKIKRGTKLVRQIRQELLNELGVEVIEDLTPGERSDFDARVNSIKYNIIKRNSIEIRDAKYSGKVYEKTLKFDLKHLTDNK